ncbi:M64 family metallopeptidase [Spirillospora sp. NPDC047418]
MRRSTRLTGTALAAAALAAGSALAAPPASADPSPAAGPGKVPVEVFSPDGSIGRTAASPDQPTPKTRALAPATVTPIEVNGPSENRIDLVFLGDGYTAGEQDLAAEHIRRSWEVLAAREPFRSYRELFNVWEVGIVSPVSGVSGDPSADVVKNTPLGAGFWCEGLERLVCADVDTVKQYAALAPGADQIGVVVNSEMYGGAGYTDDEMVTFSGGNELGPEILPHELGHSLGDLADEYPYWSNPGDGSTWDEGEPVEANVSIKPAATMRAEKTKWWYWLGEPSPDGGITGTFEGAYYTENGIYRPSDNSMMRNLRREFNLPSREKMIQSFYAASGLIDAHTPNARPVARKSTLSVDTVGIEGLSVKWYIDGREHKPWRGRTSVKVIGQGNGGTVKVVVSDPTRWVRNAAYKSGDLTETVTWRVARAGH